MSNSLAIIGGNEIYPEIFLVGYRAAFANFGRPEEAQWVLFNSWGIDGEQIRAAMRDASEIDIRSLLSGQLHASSRVEFAFAVFVAPEMYYWVRRLGLYLEYGQLISPVEAVKFYVREHLLPKQSVVHIGIIGSNEAIRLYTDFPDHWRETQDLNYVFHGPNSELVTKLTELRYARHLPDLGEGNDLCEAAIDDILEHHFVDIILLADLQTDIWYKCLTSYELYFTDVTSPDSITPEPIYHEGRNVIILSATQALMRHAAYLASLPMIPDDK